MKALEQFQGSEMSPWLFQVYGKNDVVVITAVRKQVSRARIPRVAKFQTYFDVVCVQNQCGGHKLLKYSAKNLENVNNLMK